MSKLYTTIIGCPKLETTGRSRLLEKPTAAIEGGENDFSTCGRVAVRRVFSQSRVVLREYCDTVNWFGRNEKKMSANGG